MAEARHHAVLIGIDFYRQRDGYPRLKPLHGCVRDISRMEKYLRTRPKIEHIIKLTSSHEGEEPDDKQENPAESDPRAWPTYDRIVGVFEELTPTLQAGDQVYVHYSGHGARLTSVFPEIKGAKARDEALIPFDICDPASRYLRDVELAEIFGRLVDKGAVLTVVLDCCHSGGMARGRDALTEVDADAAVRGVEFIDDPLPRRASKVASMEALARRAARQNSRSAHMDPSGLEPEGYVLLAACRPSELAYEQMFDGQRHGALSYWLHDSLTIQLRPDLSYKMLYDRVAAKVYGSNWRQTPMLMGEGGRAVFGSDQVDSVYRVAVLEVKPEAHRVKLQAGEAHGIRPKSCFAITRGGAVGDEDADQETPRMIVEVIEVRETVSWAEEQAPYSDIAVEPGDQATFIGPANEFIGRIEWVASADGDDLAGSRSAVETAVDAEPWVAFAQPEHDARWLLTVNDEQNYQICDATGAPLPYMRPPIPVAGDDSARRVVARLAHLAKFQVVADLENAHLPRWARQLAVTLRGLSEGFQPGDPIVTHELDFTDDRYLLGNEQWLALCFENNSCLDINITVFDLQPDWGIAQIHPEGDGNSFDFLGTGERIEIPICFELLDGYEEGTDLIKVFATISGTSFRWLELPELDQPVAASRGNPGNSLEELCAALTADEPPSRRARTHPRLTRNWASYTIRVDVSRSRDSGG